MFPGHSDANKLYCLQNLLQSLLVKFQSSKYWNCMACRSQVTVKESWNTETRIYYVGISKELYKEWKTPDFFYHKFWFQLWWSCEQIRSPEHGAERPGRRMTGFVGEWSSIDIVGHILVGRSTILYQTGLRRCLGVSAWRCQKQSVSRTCGGIGFATRSCLVWSFLWWNSW